MRIKKLQIKGVGIIEDATIDFDQPLLLFYGQIREGKSTILNAVRWLLGAPWPSDIIRHGESDASITMELDKGIISRSWYRAKNKETKARELTFVKDGRNVDRPASAVAALLNPFVLDQNFLVNMKEPDRKRYFAEMFAVDTNEIDQGLVTAENRAKNLRVEIKSYGEIDLTPVPTADIPALRAKLDQATANHMKQHREWNDSLTQLQTEHHKTCRQIDEDNNTARLQNSRHEEAETAIKTTERKIAELQSELEQWKIVLGRNPVLVLQEHPPAPPRIEELKLDIANFPAKNGEILTLEEQIAEANRNDVRREQLVKNQKRADEKTAKEAELEGVEKDVKDLRAQKVAKLAEVTSSCKVKGLSFREDGTFVYEETDAGMLSTSQLMRLSSEMSALYPEGFGLELIDRAESLGKSIFDFVDKAKREGTTILATIVGEAPAKVPAEVGVFVVEGGKVTKRKTQQENLI